MKVASHQTPWLKEFFENPPVEEKQALLEIFHHYAKTLSYLEVFVLVGGDHGYWREERLYYTTDSQYVLSIDSHRGNASGPSLPVVENTHHITLRTLLNHTITQYQTADSLFTNGPDHTGQVFCWYQNQSKKVILFRGFREIEEAFWHSFGAV